jgi:flavin reductase (DIM6/NTAB) family NADH-FMN oxidoreductase RutF
MLQGISEWAISGLHPAPCKKVAASRVKESVFSIEGKLLNTQEFESRETAGKKTGVLAIIEGVNFWAREDAVNEEGSILDPDVSDFSISSSVLLASSFFSTCKHISLFTSPPRRFSDP